MPRRSKPARSGRGVMGDTYTAPQHGWTCFHCGETFLIPVLARQHFGGSIDAEPACRIARSERGLVGTIRYLEERIARYRAEDSDADRQRHAIQAQHARDVRDAEQRGYERGLADMRAQGWRLNEERERPDLYPTQEPHQ